MRKSWSFFALAFFMSLSALAQETPRVELFGGNSYGRIDTGLASSGDEHHNLAGWNASVSVNLNSWFGVGADFAGYYGTPEIKGAFPPVHERVYTFMAGPQIFYRRHERWTPFAHVLFGATKVHAFVADDSLRDTAFSMAVGGGVDFKTTQHIAFRLIQADYLMTRFKSASPLPPFGNVGSTSQHSVRISGGVVFRFGG